jgi:hypothetical protein
MASQGRSLTEVQVGKMITFLSSTDMTIAQIALRMGCSRSAVAAVNRKKGIRDYAGFRTKWKSGQNGEAENHAEFMNSAGFLVS